MELLNVHVARAIWLFDIRELNPRGKTMMPDLLEWLKENYHFEKAPSSVTDLDEKTKSLAFERGEFQIKPEIFIDIEMKIFNDGFIAETRSSTHDSDTFLEDVLESATKEFSLAYKPQMIGNKLYISELHVHSPKNLAGINPKIAEFTTKIMNLVPSDLGIPFECAAVSFWPTRAMSNLAICQFRFERKINTLPTEKKYYSTAPLHTDDHLHLLDEFESAFMT